MNANDMIVPHTDTPRETSSITSNRVKNEKLSLAHEDSEALRVISD